jgi:L-threonylcarbamoyladenylate synthase
MAEGRPPLLAAGDASALREAASAMLSGGLVGIPTETVYGIAVVPRPEALAALAAAGRRPGNEGIALLIDGLDQVEGLVELTPPARRLAGRYWPGALTLVLPLLRPELVPEAVTGGHQTLSLRVPAHAIPRALARDLGPIALVSVERPGEPPPQIPEELLAAIGDSLALVLDDGPVRGGVASTIVAVDRDGALEVRREGALDAAAIYAAARGA